MTRNGRGIVIVVALTLIFSAAGFALVSAQNNGGNIKLTQNAEAEYVTVHNNGDQSYDLSGLTLSFDDGQTRFSFPDNTTLAPGETVTVGTGAKTTVETDYSASYDGYVLNNTNPDTVQLLDGDTVVASTADDGPEATTTTTQTTTKTTTDDTTTTKTTSATDDTTKTTNMTTEETTTTTTGKTTMTAKGC